MSREAKDCSTFSQGRDPALENPPYSPPQAYCIENTRNQGHGSHISTGPHPYPHCFAQEEEPSQAQHTDTRPRWDPPTAPVGQAPNNAVTQAPNPYLQRFIAAKDHRPIATGPVVNTPGPPSDHLMTRGYTACGDGPFNWYYCNMSQMDLPNGPASVIPSGLPLTPLDPTTPHFTNEHYLELLALMHTVTNDSYDSNVGFVPASAVVSPARSHITFSKDSDALFDQNYTSFNTPPELRDPYPHVAEPVRYWLEQNESPTPTPSAESLDHFEVSNYTPSRPQGVNRDRRKEHRIAPYPRQQKPTEEPARKSNTRILAVSKSAAEGIVPGISKYYGTQGKDLINNKELKELLRKTRRAVDATTSVKKQSICEFCKSQQTGSAWLYHACKHLKINPYVCSYCDDSFAQSNDLKDHIEKRHQLKPQAPPTQTPLKLPASEHQPTHPPAFLG